MFCLRLLDQRAQDDVGEVPGQAGLVFHPGDKTPCEPPPPSSAFPALRRYHKRSVVGQNPPVYFGCSPIWSRPHPCDFVYMERLIVHLIRRYQGSVLKMQCWIQEWRSMGAWGQGGGGGINSDSWDWEYLVCTARAC